MDQELNYNGSEMFTNGTDIDLGNQSSPAESKSAPTAVIAFTLSVVSWIIIANSLLIISLLMSRQNMKNVSNLQILTLAVTDAIVGISAIPPALTFYIMGSFPYYGTCAFIMGLFLTARTASLFHMLEICIYRAMVSLRRSVMTHEGRYFKLTMLVLLPWTAAICANAAIFQIYGVKNSHLTACSFSILMQYNYLRATPVLFGMWITTASLIIITYVFMSLHLLISSRRMNAQRVVVGGSHNEGVPSKSLTADMTSSGKEGLGLSVITEQSSTISTSMNYASSVTPAPISSNQKDAESKPIRLQLPTDNSDKKISDRRTQNRRPRTHTLGPNVKWQKQVLVTIGILLTVLIVCITPYAILLAMEFSSDSYYMPRAIKFIVATLVISNSAINPFVYAIRMRPLREAMKKNWMKIGRVCFRSRVKPMPATTNSSRHIPNQSR